jgi:hypothetical protein
VGFVIFGDIEDRNVRIEVPDIQHNPLIDFVRIRVGAKEFNYEPFNGMIYDLQILLGGGFVGSIEQLKDSVLPSTPKPVIDGPDRTNIPVFKGDKVFNPADGENVVTETYTQFADVKEYGVSGWFRFNRATA